MYRFLILTLFGLISYPNFAQGQLFESEEILQLALTSDFQHFINDRSMDADYQKATLSYDFQENREEIEVKIKVRGRFRRDSMVCDFPPIRLKFSKNDDFPQPFTDQRKIKMVTHCQEEESILREYYIYKMYRLFTEKSFRVRLCEVTYIDENGALPEETHFAFLIESEKELTERLDEKSLDEDIVIRKEEVNQHSLARLYLFHYMIANTDFGVLVRQNVKIITNGKSRPIVVPYDFDWAGLVAASYTLESRAKSHDPYLDRKKFKKLCVEEEDWKEIISEFNEKKEAIFSLYEDSPYLSFKTKERTLELLGDFFKEINRKKTISKVLMKHCK
jgi:hypothetical protein